MTDAYNAAKILFTACSTVSLQALCLTTAWCTSGLPHDAPSICPVYICIHVHTYINMYVYNHMIIPFPYDLISLTNTFTHAADITDNIVLFTDGWTNSQIGELKFKTFLTHCVI